MKGAIARMGNTTETKTFYIKKFGQIPKKGEYMDGKYVVSVACEYHLDAIKTTVVLSENYNQIMPELGLQSNYRAYDISEKQSFDRQIAYAEDVIIGDKLSFDSDLAFREAGCTIAGASRFAEVFKNESSQPPVTFAVAQGVTNGIEQTQVSFPVLSHSFGNSLLFNFSYLDNFSAGYKSIPITGTGEGFKNEQRAVQHSDVYGEIESLKVAFYNDASQAGFDPNALPEYVGGISAYPQLDYRIKPIRPRKDSREVLSVNFLQCMRTNRKGIVLGSALCSRNPLVSRVERNVTMYFLSQRLNVLNPWVDLTGAIQIAPDINRPIYDENDPNSVIHFSYSGGGNYGSILIKSVQNRTPGNFRAWAIVNHVGNRAELLLGENMEIPQFGYTNETYIQFPSNRYKEDIKK